MQSHFVLGTPSLTPVDERNIRDLARSLRRPNDDRPLRVTVHDAGACVRFALGDPSDPLPFVKEELAG